MKGYQRRAREGARKACGRYVFSSGNHAQLGSPSLWRQRPRVKAPPKVRDEIRKGRNAGRGGDGGLGWRVGIGSGLGIPAFRRAFVSAPIHSDRPAMAGLSASDEGAPEVAATSHVCPDEILLRAPGVPSRSLRSRGLHPTPGETGACMLWVSKAGCWMSPGAWAAVEEHSIRHTRESREKGGLGGASRTHRG